MHLTIYKIVVGFKDIFTSNQNVFILLPLKNEVTLAGVG